MRVLLGLCLAVGLVVGTPTEAVAQQPTAVIFTIDVPVTQVGAFLELIGKVEPLIETHAPEADLSAWATIVGGPHTNRMQVVTIFPSAEAWGAARPKIVGDPAYQEVIQSLDGIGAEVLSVELLANIVP